MPDRATTTGPAAAVGDEHVSAAAVAGPGSRETDPALSRCVAMDISEFASGYWGQAPLLTTSAAGFDDLLSPSDVDELLSRRGLRTPFLRIAKDGVLVPAAQFAGSGGLGAEIADQVRDDRVMDLVASGATLVLQGLHRMWPPLIDYCAQLGEELACAVQANAYLTPAGNRGFATHYDTHDVFVLQVTGRKRWRIHAPVLTDPLEQQPWGGRADEVSATASGAPVLDVVLNPGDVLYLPRGWLHAADALGELSLHLTLGLRRPTRYTLVEALLRMCAEDQNLRAGFGFGVDATDPDQLEPELVSTVDQLTTWLRTVDPDAVAARLRPSLWSASRPGPLRPIAQAIAAATVDTGTVIGRRVGLRWRLYSDDNGVVLELTGRTVRWPMYCEPALRAALAADNLRVGELPGLDDADRIVLARRLLREAVVTTN